MKREILPDDQVDFADVLAALESAGFISRYTDEKETYGVVPTIDRWQHFHHREKSDKQIPDPPRSLIRKGAPGKPPTSPTASASASASASAYPPKGSPDGWDDEEQVAGLDAEPPAQPRRKKRRPSTSPSSKDTYVDRVIRGEA